jgi:hypothetical protein
VYVFELMVGAFDLGQTIDRTRPHMVPMTIYPDNGVHRVGEAIFVSFTTEV